MPKWLKLVLGVVLGLLLLCGGVVGLAVRWVSQNRDTLESRVRQSAEDLRRSADEGQVFGRGQPPDICLDEAVRRSGDCGLMSMGCRMDLHTFFRACLKVSTLSPAFCAGVPGRLNLVKAGTWMKTECRKRGQGGRQPCQEVLSVMQEHCAGLEAQQQAHDRPGAP